jgi:hypothetical protein
MRASGATTPETNQTAATNALIALVRLLAREMAREYLGQTAAPPETANSVDRTAGSDAGPRVFARKSGRLPARSLGEDGAASDRSVRASPNKEKRGKR